jgi:uncharacterized damage-inducible protein DinB
VPLPEGVLQRLATQLDAIPALLGDLAPAELVRRPIPDGWSAHENLAHLGRYHEVFLERTARILAEERPHLPRYRAEDDPQAPAWMALPTVEVLKRTRALRKRLAAVVGGCSDAQLAREGIHPTFGALTLAQWLDFFLVHEAHHLYVAVLRARG